MAEWGFRQCLPFRGKHCQHPIAVMGVVDMFRHGELFREIGGKNDIQLFHLRAIRDHPFKAQTFLGGRDQTFAKFANGQYQKNCRRWGVGVKNHRNLPTSSMDGTQRYHSLTYLICSPYLKNQITNTSLSSVVILPFTNVRRQRPK